MGRYLTFVFDALKRINTIIIDLDRDIWTYVSMEYFKQKIKDGEISFNTKLISQEEFLTDEKVFEYLSIKNKKNHSCTGFISHYPFCHNAASLYR